MNEGLEVLRVEEVIYRCASKENVFSGSKLESIMIPATLKKIECGNYTVCERVQRVEFLEGREVLGKDC